MAAPQLSVYTNGPIAVSGDQLNTFMQTCDTAAQMRGIIGVTGISLSARGIGAVNDGLGGLFYWNSTSAGPDDNLNTIVPSGAKQGAWVRQTSPITQAITNIAALRALVGATGATTLTVFVTGYYLGGDGGGGVFWYNPADTTSADNGGTIIVDGSGRRWYRESSNGILNIGFFGAKTDGTDVSAALAQALATLPAAGGQVFFGAGKWTFASAFSLTMGANPSSVSFVGAGTDATELYWPGGGGLTVACSNSRHGVHVRDLTLTTGAIGVGNALKLTNSVQGGNYAQSDITRVTIRGADGGAVSQAWATCIDVMGLGNINYDGVLMYGGSAASNGIIVAGIPGSGFQYSLIHNLTKCSFNNLSIGFTLGTYVQGVTITQSNFTNGATGVLVQSGAVDATQLTLTANQIAGSGNPVVIAAPMAALIMSDNLLYIPAGATGVLFTAAGTGQQQSIKGNVFSGQSLTSTTGIDLIGNNISGVIQSNTFYNLNVGVNLVGSPAGWNVQGNIYPGTTTPTANVGSNSVGVATS